MIKIFGPYGLPVSEGKQLTGSFSGHLHHCVFLFVDEAFWAGNVAIEGRLKSLITEETITTRAQIFHNILCAELAAYHDVLQQRLGCSGGEGCKALRSLWSWARKDWGLWIFQSAECRD
jgi:hypothetical protein